MAHFAHVDPNTGIVDCVLVVEQAYIDAKGGCALPTGEFKPKEEWVQTSYNTLKGVHKDGGTPLRKNFAGIGFKHDKVRDAFIPPQPFLSWVLDEATCTWKAPKQKPADESPDKPYRWDEAKGDFVESLPTKVTTK